MIFLHVFRQAPDVHFGNRFDNLPSLVHVEGNRISRLLSEVEDPKISKEYAGAKWTEKRTKWFEYLYILEH